MVFHEQPSDPWTGSDFRLLEAYQIMQDESCGHCGHPVWLCRNPDVEWEVRTSTCESDRSITTWREQQTDSDGKSKVKNGVHPYAIPFVFEFSDDGSPVKEFTKLPSREDFYTKDSVD